MKNQILFLLLLGLIRGQELDSTDSPVPSTVINFQYELEDETTTVENDQLDIPSENLSSSTSRPTTMTTTKGPSTSTTTPPKLEQEPSKFQIGAYCTCDLTVNSCDVNCCCDPDCSEIDRSAFSGCYVIRSPYLDERYCFKSEIIYANNSEYVVETDEDGLLCIVKDNAEETKLLLDREPVLNATEFEKLEQRFDKPDPFWHWNPDENFDLGQAFNISNYSAGSAIWVYYPSIDELELFRIPGEAEFEDSEDSDEIFATCNSPIPVKYLLKSESNCEFSGRELRAERCEGFEDVLDATGLGSDMKIVRNPEFFRNESLNQDPFLSVIVHKCEIKGGQEKCLRVNPEELPSPTADCRNLISGVHFEIIHEGVQGIESVTAKVFLGDLRPSAEKWTVKYSYVHFWTTDTNRDHLEERSGNPGYIDGKPLLVGVLRKNDTSVSESEENWFIEKSPYLISLQPDFDNGECLFLHSEGERERIGFGFTRTKRCHIDVDMRTAGSLCNGLKADIIKLLIGGEGDIEPLYSARVAAYGTGNVSHPADWAPLLVADAPLPTATQGNNANRPDGSADPSVCPNVVSSLEITVAFAKVGAVINPQSKLVGIRYKFGPPIDLKLKCDGTVNCKLKSKKKFQRLTVETKVRFVDLTEPASELFKEFPVFEARFPNDFFYPFLTGENEDTDRRRSRSTNSGSNANYQWSLLLLLNLTIYAFNSMISGVELY